MFDFGTQGNAILASGTVRLAILMRINSTPVIRMWAAVGEFPKVADLIETASGALYQGVGEMLSVPALTQLVNGKADRVDFSLSGEGVDAALVNLAVLEAGMVEFCRFNIGVQILGDDWQTVGPCVWLWEGEAGPVSGNRDGSRSTPEHTMSLSVGSAFAARRRARAVNFTNAHQQRLYPGDLFFNRVGLYSGGTTRKWP